MDAAVPGRARLGRGAGDRPTSTLSPTRAPATTSRRASRASRWGSRASGVSGVEKVVRIRDELFLARLDCFVDLGHDQKGAHMSRFDEVVNEAIGEVVLSESPFRAETLARHIAELVRERQGAERAEVTIAARYPEHKPAPVSGIQTQEIYTLHGRAVAFEHGTRGTVGVSATGMTACPVRAGAGGGARARAPRRAGLLGRSRSSGSSRACRWRRTTSAGWRRCRSAAPRSARREIDAATLLEIAEASMSSEIYELMKRSDEVEVVEKAHRRPRFVEDCVREMIAGVVRTFTELDGASFVSARQENLETIHQHNVVAERHGLLVGAARGDRLGRAERPPDDARGVAERGRAGLACARAPGAGPRRASDGAAALSGALSASRRVSAACAGAAPKK